MPTGLALQGETIKAIGSTCRGSYIVGEYIYILADVLYRAPIEGDTIGTLEPLSSIGFPNSIISDGTYLYVGGQFGGANSRLIVVRVSDFTILTTLLVSGVTNSINLQAIDAYGNIHMLEAETNWRVYGYDSFLNTFNLISNIAVGFPARGLVLNDGLVSICRQENALYVYSWDGTTGSLLYSNNAGGFVSLTRLVNFKNYFFGSPIQGTTAEYMFFDVNTTEATKLQTNKVSALVEQRSLQTDGNYVYSLGSTTLTILDVVDTEIVVLQTISIVNPLAQYLYPNAIHCGNNRVYVADGANLKVLRWSVKAAFTSENTEGRTWQFTAV